MILRFFSIPSSVLQHNLFGDGFFARLRKQQVASRNKFNQRTLTIGGSINVQLTSCLTGLDLTKQGMLMLIQQKQAAKSKENKQSVSRIVRLPLRLVFSGLIYMLWLHKPF